MSERKRKIERPCVEERLYRAFKADRGVRLSADEVWDLIGLDDAMRTRIANTFAAQYGCEEVGFEDHDGALFGPGGSIKKFVAALVRDGHRS